MLTPESRTAPRSNIQLSWQVLERTWLLALIAGTLLLALTNLPYAPRTWFDEGSHLHVPKTLIEHGVYADISSEGYRYYGLASGILVFSFVAYLLIVLAAGYALARRLHGRRVALLAVTFLLASRTFSYEGMIEYGRQVAVVGWRGGLYAEAALAHAGERVVVLAELPIERREPGYAQGIEPRRVDRLEVVTEI